MWRKAKITSLEEAIDAAGEYVDKHYPGGSRRYKRGRKIRDYWIVIVDTEIHYIDGYGRPCTLYKRGMVKVLPSGKCFYTSIKSKAWTKSLPPPLPSSFITQT